MSWTQKGGLRDPSWGFPMWPPVCSLVEKASELMVLHLFSLSTKALVETVRSALIWGAAGCSGRQRMHLRFASLGAPVSQPSHTGPSVGQCQCVKLWSSALTCLIKCPSLSKGSWKMPLWRIAAESQALFSRAWYNLNHCPPTFCSSLQPTCTCKSLSNLMCPVVSAFACQSESRGF